jgi:hypothetical protein
MEREERYGASHGAENGTEKGAREAHAPGAHGREHARGEGAQVIRLRPLRVLIVSADEPFRTANAMLLGRRDCVVFGLNDVYGAAELLARERIDVAVVDGAEQLRALADDIAHAAPLVGVVSVGEAEDVGLPGGPMLARWAPFEELFDALTRADRARAHARVAGGCWPEAVWSRKLD